MNNLISNFDQILAFAHQYQLPLTQKRAILREYLQIKILDVLYQQSLSPQLIFVGGTSLRLTKNLDRFSEDLDFDLQQITTQQLDLLINQTFQLLNKENFYLELYRNQTTQRTHYEFRFKTLLYKLEISRHSDEKLAIKFDFDQYWRGHQRQTILINRYGFLVKVITVPLNQFLVQKLTAYLNRKATQPRDLYDIIWLKAQGAQTDQQFIQANQLPQDLVTQVIKKFQREKSKLSIYKRRLKPFLINENYVNQL